MKRTKINRICALVLTFFVVFSLLSQTVMAENIYLSPGESEFTYTVSFAAIKDAYASGQFNVVIDDMTSLDIKRDTNGKMTGVTFKKGLNGVVSEGRMDGNQVTYKIGFTSGTGENVYSSSMDICDIVFKYSGEQPRKITINNFEIFRFTGLVDKVPQYSKEALNWVKSLIVSEQKPIAESPSASPAPGTYSDTQNVTLSTATGGAQIYYTLDGSAPTVQSTQYSGPITITKTTTIKAMAVKDGYENSATVTFSYTISNNDPGGNDPGGNDPGGNDPGTNNPGTSNPGTGTVTIGDDNVPLSPVAFTDLDGYDWAREAIDYISQKGIVVGDGKGHFNPKLMITRADFVLMLYRIAGFKAEKRATFEDLPKSAEYKDAIENAAGCGIIEGIGSRKFKPFDKITRQDAAVIVYRLLNYLEKVKPSTGSISAFKDSDKVSAYALDAVTFLVREEILQGGDGLLRPKSQITRAEAAVLLYRVIKKYELLK
ncbi:MAG TPA: S-layer homology domain-containing protein [Clostridia bacterium]|nr:S-layer homology domain-containing protein [Clostridia bacterium]